MLKALDNHWWQMARGRGEEELEGKGVAVEARNPWEGRSERRSRRNSERKGWGRVA